MTRPRDMSYRRAATFPRPAQSHAGAGLSLPRPPPILDPPPVALALSPLIVLDPHS